MILGIETSCDETSVAILDRTGAVRANLISSQIERHRPFGGVVPEIASREHLEHLFPIVEQALTVASVSWKELEAIAVTAGPGLIGALLVGVAGAQGIAYGLGIPVIPVNHLEGHIFSPYLQGQGKVSTPRPDRFLSLVISGGHSSIYEVDCRQQKPVVTMINRTRDDAIGETFDKVAKFIGLPYPGGPQIETKAALGTIDGRRFPFPVPQFKDVSLDFSYSGIKAAAIRMAREKQIHVDGDPRLLADFCATFQEALFAQLFDRLDALWSRNGMDGVAEVVLAGGVAANGALRSKISAWGERHKVIVRLPEKVFCTDNAAMIAFAALQVGTATDARRVAARSRV